MSSFFSYGKLDIGTTIRIPKDNFPQEATLGFHPEISGASRVQQLLCRFCIPISCSLYMAISHSSPPFPSGTITALFADLRRDGRLSVALLAGISEANELTTEFGPTVTSSCCSACCYTHRLYTFQQIPIRACLGHLGSHLNRRFMLMIYSL